MSKNSARGEDSTDQEEAFDIDFMICCCKKARTDPKEFLLKYYILEVVNSLTGIVWASAFFSLHNQSIIRLHNHSEASKRTVFLVALLWIFVLALKTLCASFLRGRISSNQGLDMFAWIPKFGKVVNYLILISLAYLSAVVVIEGSEALGKTSSESDPEEMKWAKILLFAYCFSILGIVCLFLAVVSQLLKSSKVTRAFGAFQKNPVSNSSFGEGYRKEKKHIK